MKIPMLAVLFCCLLLTSAPPLRAAPLGTGFTYQGELRVSGVAANGEFDFEFHLFDGPSTPASLASSARPSVNVNTGLFSVELDYTEVPFATSETFWLEVRVRPSGGGAFTALSPRQKITPVPYALQAQSVRDNSIASVDIINNSISGADILDNSLTSVDISDGTITGTDIANDSIMGVDIADNSISSADILDGNISNSKLADQAVTSSKLAAGAVTGFAIANGAISSQAIADNAVSSDKIGLNAVESENLASSSVTTFNIADNAITNVKISDGAVTSNKIGSQSITGDKIAPSAISNDQISNGAVDALKISNDSVQTRHIASNAITNLKIADASVTANKLAAGVGTGDVTGVVAGFGLNGGGASGDVNLSVNSTVVQSRISNPCTTGKFIVAISREGIADCRWPSGVPTIVAINNANTDFSMAIRPDGTPIFSYALSVGGQPSFLQVVGCDDPSCSTGLTFNEVDNPINAVGTNSSIAIGQDGFPIISFFDIDGTALKVAKCIDAECTVGTSIINTIDDTPGMVPGVESVIVVPADGLPVIAYRETVFGAVKVAKCNNSQCTAWTTTEVENGANDVGLNLSMTTRQNSVPIIAYQDMVLKTLKVAACVLPDCSGTTSGIVVDDPPNAVGSDSSIALDANGLAVISYRDTTAGALKVLRCANLFCSAVSTVTLVEDNANSLGFSTNIAIGADNLPVIAHVSNSFSEVAVRITKCGNPGCTIAASSVALAAPPSIVSTNLAMLLGADGLPTVAYKELPLGEIKVARCGNRSCQ